MYAIAFDLNTAALDAEYPGDSSNNAYPEIGRVLDKHGFNKQQGSVYFGGEGVTAVDCVLAVQDVARTYRWFSKTVVRDIRMLRIEDDNDLSVAF